MVNNCVEIAELLSEYMDGELSAEESARVEKHTAACNTCSKKLERLNLTVELMRNLPKYQASTGLLTEVRKEIKKRWTIRDLARPVLKWGGALMAALVLFCFKANGILPVGQNPVLEKQPAMSKNKSAAAKPAGKTHALKKKAEANGMHLPLPGEKPVSRAYAQDLPLSGRSLSSALGEHNLMAGYEGETSETASGLEQKNLVIRSEDDWKSFYSSAFPGNDVPQVDFAQKMVISVFGSKNVSITSARAGDGKFLVSYRDDRNRGRTAALFCSLMVVQKSEFEVVFTRE